MESSSERYFWLAAPAAVDWLAIPSSKDCFGSKRSLRLDLERTEAICSV